MSPTTAVMKSDLKAPLSVRKTQQAAVDSSQDKGVTERHVPVVDLRHDTPQTELSTTFPGSSTLQCRLTPCPHTFNSVYFLDFISDDGRRVDTGTNVAVYDVGTFGDENPRQILPIGNEQPSHSSLDVYILNPRRASKIVLPDPSSSNPVIKMVHFSPTFSPSKYEPHIT